MCFCCLVTKLAVTSCGDSPRVELPSRGLLLRVLALESSKATTALSSGIKITSMLPTYNNRVLDTILLNEE